MAKKKAKSQPPPSPIIAELRAAVRASGRSLGELSRATGIPKPSLSRFVNAIEGLGGGNLDLLAAELGLKLMKIGANSNKAEG